MRSVTDSTDTRKVRLKTKHTRTTIRKITMSNSFPISRFLLSCSSNFSSSAIWWTFRIPFMCDSSSSVFVLNFDEFQALESNGSWIGEKSLYLSTITVTLCIDLIVPLAKIDGIVRKSTFIFRLGFFFFIWSRFRRKQLICLSSDVTLVTKPLVR